MDKTFRPNSYENNEDLVPLNTFLRMDFQLETIIIEAVKALRCVPEAANGIGTKAIHCGSVFFLALLMW